MSLCFEEDGYAIFLVGEKRSMFVSLFCAGEILDSFFLTLFLVQDLLLMDSRNKYINSSGRSAFAGATDDKT